MIFTPSEGLNNRLAFNKIELLIASACSKILILFIRDMFESKIEINSNI